MDPGWVGGSLFTRTVEQGDIGRLDLHGVDMGDGGCVGGGLYVDDIKESRREEPEPSAIYLLRKLAFFN